MSQTQGDALLASPAARPRRWTRWLPPAAPKRRWVAGILLVLTALALYTASPHLIAWYHFRAARSELQRYHNPQAIRYLRLCRQTWPRDPEVLLLAARAARRARVYGDCERLLWMYRDLRGRDDALALEQLLLAAERRVDEVADQCWQHIEDRRSDAPLLLEALTRGYLRQYRLGQARLCLDRWKQMQPDNAQVYYLEGLFLFDYLRVRSAAADSYRRALELDPEHEEARLGLAVALLQGKSFAEAAEQFEQVLKCQPDNVRVQVGLAECRDDLGQAAEAVRLVEEVLARQPRSAAALSLRGQIALKSGELAAAEDWLRQALRLNAMDHRARYNLTLCLERSGQDEEAGQQRRQLEQMEADVTRFHAIVTREIAQRPTDAVLHCELGQLLWRGGQREEGLRWLESALRLDPQQEAARRALAASLHQAQAETPPDSP